MATKKKKGFTFSDKCMLIGHVPGLAGLILGILAGSLDPRAHIIIAFFGLAYPLFLLANALFFLYWLFRKRWAIASITLIVVGIGWHSLFATFGLGGTEGPERKTDPDLLRLLTYNVHNFKPYGESNTVEEKDKIFQILAGQMPDIVCFQEFYSRDKGPYDTIDSLKKQLDMPYYYFEPTHKSKREALGVAIFSRFPIENRGAIAFENSTGNSSIYVDVRVHNQLLRIYNVHLQSISFEKEDYSYLDQVTKEMDPALDPSKRIIRMLRGAFKKRSEQVDIMKAHMQTCRLPYVVAGDFNDTPASYATTRMTDSLYNAFYEKGSGFGKTYNGKFPNFQIDYIACTKNIQVMNYKIIKARLSDHFPVRSDLRLPLSGDVSE